ncbi:MAG: hypothetical protein LUH17_09550 [Acidaminococcaceae bacterium]|nr:hypothetical protein [Acidaminococcaceae bacterium]
MRFSLLGILNTYWSLWGESWLINTSSIFIIVAGLVSGPLIGFAVALLIAGHYILLIHTKAALVSGCFFLIEGLLSGFLSAWLKHKKRNAAPRHRDQFYFRCQSHHFAGSVLLSL